MTYDDTSGLPPAAHNSRISSAEGALRAELAAAYRLTAHFGWDMLIFGHITARVPGPERHFLINPYGLMFDEITASSLVKIDLDGNRVDGGEGAVNPAGFVIHSAIHAARDDAHCVMHTHTRDGMAVAALRDGLGACDFAGIALHGRVGYHDFEGVTVRDDERTRLVESLGGHDHLVLRNHGLLTCGRTVAEAFVNMHGLQTACEVQVAARGTGAALVEPPVAVRERHARALDDGGDCGRVFDALVRRMDRLDPSFRH